jgi:hypothetical protein
VPGCCSPQTSHRVGQHGLGVPELGAGHVVALEGADKRFGQAVALRTVRVKSNAVLTFAPTLEEVATLRKTQPDGSRPVTRGDASPPSGALLDAVQHFVEGGGVDQMTLARNLRDVPASSISAFGRALADLRATQPVLAASGPSAARVTGIAPMSTQVVLGSFRGPTAVVGRPSALATRSAVAAFEYELGISFVGSLHLERVDMIPAGTERGELIANVVLAPAETVTIFHKEWSTMEQDFQSIVTDSLEGYSETGVTEKSELSQSTDSQTKHSSSLDLSAQASGKYPFITVSANSDIQLSNSIQQAEKASRNHTQSETRKASLRTKKEHKVTVGTISTVGREDSTSRTVTNPSQTNAMRVDYFSMMRKWHVKLYRYDVRMTFDLVVPEPGEAFRELYDRVDALNALLAKPFVFATDDGHVITPEQINYDNYAAYEAQYGVTLEAPPAAHQTFLKADSHMPGDNPINSILSWSFGFDVPESYGITGAKLDAVLGHGDYTNRMFKFLGGPDDLLASLPNRQGGNLHLEMYWLHGKTGHVDLTYVTQRMDVVDVGIEFTATILPEALHAWQVASWKTLHQRALESHNEQVQQWQQQREALNSQILSGDTLTLRRQEAEEIMKSVMRWLFGPQFQVVPQEIVALAPPPSRPGGLTAIDDPHTLGGEGPWNLVLHHGEVVKFLHEAIEWENVTYFLYPYFWDLPGNWDTIRRLAHPDPTRQAFLRAGRARVVLTVRRGFEKAFASIMELGAFGSELPKDHPYVTIAEDIENYANTNYPGIPPANPQGQPPPIDNPAEAGVLIAEWFEYTPTGALDIEVTSLPPAGPAPPASQSKGTVITKTVDLAALAEDDVVARFAPGFTGTIARLAFEPDIPVKTANKAATLTARIAGTAIDGGVLQLTSMDMKPRGHTVGSTLITGHATFTDAQEITVVATAVTPFREGMGTLYLFLD